MAEGPRVTHILEATVGGTARHLVDVGCGLARAGIRQEAILSRRSEEDFSEKAERLAAAGVAVTWVPMVREPAPAGDARALLRILRHLRRSRPDIVHTHSSKAGVLGRAAAVLAGVPVIVHSPHAFPFQMRVGRARRALYLALERAAARRTHCLVAVSHAEAELAVAAAGYSSKQAVVIGNGVDPARAARPEEGAAFRREEGIPEDAPIVLFVGRLVQQKAPDVLLRAARRVLASHPRAVFLLVGRGPRFEDVAREVAPDERDHIRLLGYRQDIARIYAAANVFALPSRWEGLPYSPLEAMSAGLPVVASDIGPLREIVAAGQTGLLAPPDDPEALAACLASLLDDLARARALGAAGRARVLAHYTLQRQVDRLAELYRTLVG